MDSLVRIESAHPLISSPLGGEDKGEGGMILSTPPPSSSHVRGEESFLVEREGWRAEKNCLFRYRNFGIYNI